MNKAAFALIIVAAWTAGAGASHATELAAGAVHGQRGFDPAHRFDPNRRFEHRGFEHRPFPGHPQHFRGDRNVIITAPFWWAAPAGYPPAVYFVPQQAAPPAVYFDEAPPDFMEQQSGYLFYCRNPAGYFPEVEACSEGWLRLAPAAPPQ